MAEAVLEARDVTYRYPSAEVASLDGASLTVRRGELVLLTGPSGSGKSTLLRCFLGLVPHLHGGEIAGQVRTLGQDVATTLPHQLAPRIGMVFQNPEDQLVATVVESDVAFGPENLGLPRDEISRRVERALARVGIAHLRQRSVHELSVGQQQKVALASVLALEPEVLLLDEPTSSLDPRSARDLIAQLHRLNRESGLTVVLAEHRLEMALPLADRLVVMARGRVLRDGPTREVVAAGGLGEIGVGLPWVVEHFRGRVAPEALPLSVEEAAGLERQADPAVPGLQALAGVASPGPAELASYGRPWAGTGTCSYGQSSPSGDPAGAARGRPESGQAPGLAPTGMASRAPDDPLEWPEESLPAGVLDGGSADHRRDARRHGESSEASRASEPAALRATDLVGRQSGPMAADWRLQPDGAVASRLKPPIQGPRDQLDTPREDTPPDGLEEGRRENRSKDARPLVEVRALRHVYPDGQEALRGVDLAVGTGEVVALLGESGAGKSTLARHLIGLLRPTSGQVLIEGRDAGRETVARLAETVGYVFQNPLHQLFAETVEAEIALGPLARNWPHEAAAAQVDGLLARFGIERYRRRHPLALSEGERRRVALAATLATRPRLLVLDEPTVGQDQGEKERLGRLIAELAAEGCAVLIITHDVEFAAERCPRIVVLARGVVLADGPSAALLRDRDLLSEAALEPPQAVQLAELVLI